MHRLPDAALELSAGFFDGFERAGDDAIDGDKLAAEPVGGFANNAIEFLCLAAREIDDVSGVGNHFGNFRLSVVEQESGRA